MAFEVLMPQLGLTMEEGTVSQWIKHEGDEVKAGDVILEITTDKLTNEVASEHDGVLLKIVAQEGEDIPVKGLLAYIGQAGESISGGASAPAPAAVPAAEAAPAAPAAATASTKRVIARSPARAGIPNICSSRAPAPAIIPMVHPKRKMRNTAEKNRRRGLLSCRRIILSNSRYPVRLAIERDIQLKTPKAAMVRTIPASPQRPNCPKNCKSSCPERKPAPKKLPV